MRRITPYPLILLSFILLSCGGGSLEDRGREVGEKWCACENLEWHYEAQMDEAMLDAMKADVTLSEDSVERIGRKWRDEHREEESREVEACERELKAMQIQMAIDFPKDEDRETLENLAHAMREKCRLELKDAEEEITKALVEMKEQRGQIR